MAKFNKIYYVSNAYQFTNSKTNELNVVLECIPQVEKSVQRLQKFYFTLQELEDNGMISFYDKDVPGVGFNHLYVKTQVEYNEDILMISENKEDLK